MSTGPITPDGIEVTLGDGSVVKGATLQEAFDNLKAMKESTAKWAREQRDRNEELAAENERFRQEQEERERLAAEAAEPPQTTQAGYSPETYYDLLNSDPIAAQNYIDQARFGVTDPVAAFGQMRADQEYLQTLLHHKFGALAIQNFLNRHDNFPQDADAASAMESRIGGLMRSGKFGAEVPQMLDNLPQIMDTAYSQLTAEGVIKRVRDDTVAPNPSLTGSGGTTSHVEAENMSDEDLKRLLISHGMLQSR